MPYIIALTGGIGSGKTTIANKFAMLGIKIIDADIIAREVVKPGSQILLSIVKRYGKSVLTDRGTLFRRQLREIIFQSMKETKWLNNLIHPLIKIKTEQLKININSPYIIWVIPLLVENKLQKYANRILVVNIHETIQLKRLLIRDNITLSQAKLIISRQASQEYRLSYANDIIDNNGKLVSTLFEVTKLHQLYLTLASN